ncbi:putative hydrolase [Durotheca rogersii]|uniref:putative hydrolase n=1 Tax=Durotheca rogersii TaxID=419775 RepID=UPI0022208359|nr:putative hydrolase [Durotheca rogersii]KAI5863354.1 putative hydrolase [Durotheca rogersii]
MGRLTIIKNVRVFDGEAVSGPKEVVIDGSRIGDADGSDDVLAANEDVVVVDGTGRTLMPGLFDCHVHIRDAKQLAACSSFGVTTVCDMACMPLKSYQALRAAQGPTRWLASGLPAYEENSRHGILMKFLGITADHAVHNVDEAAKFVQNRVDEGVDYIKIIADEPGHEQAVLDRIQDEAKKHGMRTVAHAAQYKAFERGLKAGFDVLTHVPMDKALDDKVLDEMVRQKTVAVPTLTMMEAMTNSWILWGLGWILRTLRQNRNFRVSLSSVTAMRKAGIPILAGTDANDSGIVSVAAGESLHRELELLVRAGLTPADALRAATSAAAQHFDLLDRGRIRPGLRADLVLVDGEPYEDITATRRIAKVWSGGEEVPISTARRGTCAWSCMVM